MMSNSKYTYEKYVMEEFEFDYGRVLNNVEVEYTTRGTPKYDDEGNIINAFIFCHRFTGDCSSLDDLSPLIGPEGILADYNFFYHIFARTPRPLRSGMNCTVREGYTTL